jgi:hypothetical protein
VGDDFESNAESLTPEPSTLGQDTDTDTAADDMDSSAPSMTPEHRGAPTLPDTDLAADSLEPTDATELDTNTWLTGSTQDRRSMTQLRNSGENAGPSRSQRWVSEFLHSSSLVCRN